MGGWVCVKWIQLDQEEDQLRNLVNMEMKLGFP
jgi:hypothetical protein